MTGMGTGTGTGTGKENGQRGRALIMVNAESQGLVTAQCCCVGERWCFPESVGVKSITTTRRASRDDMDGERGRALIMENAKS